MQNKKVLIICYYWPPAGGPGVQRWLKFVKYLPQFGIDPVVYIPDGANYPIIDKSLQAEIPEGITILRKPIREPYRYAAMLSRKHTKSISAGLVPETTKQSVLQRFLLFIRGNVFIPDARVLWVKPSMRFLKKYIKQQEIDTVITTGPPHSLHLIGYGLKKHNTTINWITDFRDPWTTISYHDKLKMSSWAKKKHKALESKILNAANSCIVTSPTTQQDFKQLTSRPVHIITNGYDDYDPIETTPSTTFTIAHIGSLLTDRNPEILWQCLQELKQEKRIAQDFKIQLVGEVSEAIVTTIIAYHLEDHLDLVGYVSHQEALVYQHKASILLLIEIDKPETKAIIPGKIFEYLQAGRPIVALGPLGADIKTILQETNAGTFVTYTEKEVLKETIAQEYINFQKGELTSTRTTISKYHRKALTKELAHIIENIL